MITNPSFRNENGEPKLVKSVVAFCDILGYQELIKKIEKNKEQEELLKLWKSLNENFVHLQDDDSPSESSWVVKAFTDNFVIGYPLTIRQDAEAELIEIMSRLAQFQFGMLCSGYVLRGAISVGTAYVDSEIFFGSALIEATDAEKNLALFPRMILSQSATEHLSNAARHYGKFDQTPQSNILLQDSDGQMFLDYLEQTILIAEEDTGPFYEELKLHKRIVENNLREKSESARARVKYLWVANYHNTFCERHQKYFDKTFLIDISEFRRMPFPRT